MQESGSSDKQNSFFKFSFGSFCASECQTQRKYYAATNPLVFFSIWTWFLWKSNFLSSMQTSYCDRDCCSKHTHTHWLAIWHDWQWWWELSHSHATSEKHWMSHKYERTFRVSPQHFSVEYVVSFLKSFFDQNKHKTNATIANIVVGCLLLVDVHVSHSSEHLFPLLEHTNIHLP